MAKKPKSHNPISPGAQSPDAGDRKGVVAAGRDEAAQALGRRGGQARAKALSKERRQEIARNAAKSRWGEKD